MAPYDALLKPLRLRHLTIRNRIMSTSHAPAYAKDALPQERYQLYHEEKAKGGIGLTMFGGSSVVSLDCPATFGQLSVADDRVIPYFQSFAVRVHRHGAALMCQLSHMGRRTRWDAGDWLPPVSPSHLREPEHRSFPKAMEDWDIRRIVRDFGQAARRCKEGGLDGVELYFSAAHLIAQFWSPHTNKRTDRYGGSLENRMRFSFEVLDEVRKQVGSDFILGLRIVVDELAEDGLSQEEGVEIAKRLAKTGLADFMNVQHGTPKDYRGLAVVMPNMSFPVAPFLYLASAIKAEVDIPVFHAGRITDLATAARAIEDGHVDMVAMTRGHLADPHLSRKLAEGRPEDVRQCVGANYCIDRIYVGGEALCIQNPATGREASLPHVVPRAPAKKKVVVAGAGVAGLEAARVAAERGHDVVLFEASERTGGQVNLAAKAAWREGLAGITRWLDSQVRKLNVDIRLGAAATAEAVMAERPDVVIVATGGAPNKGDFTGHELAASTWNILEGRIVPTGDVLLYDDHGGHAAPSVAEVLAARGVRVELVTPERAIGPEFGATNWPIHLRELYKRGVVLSPDLRLMRVAREGERFVATLRNEYTLEEEERVVDLVIAEHGTLPKDALYFALKAQSTNGGALDLRLLASNQPQTLVTNPEGSFRLFRVGDAVASRNIHAAIYDSLRLCKDI
jgi:2,4-dienoyl-CoA reductase-like NADH-dependent reductase (Old Yellow Enzyme family)/thioredoxin reductase